MRDVQLRKYTRPVDWWQREGGEVTVHELDVKSLSNAKGDKWGLEPGSHNTGLQIMEGGGLSSKLFFVFLWLGRCGQNSASTGFPRFSGILSEGEDPPPREWGSLRPPPIKKHIP